MPETDPAPVSASVAGSGSKMLEITPALKSSSPSSSTTVSMPVTVFGAAFSVMLPVNMPLMAAGVLSALTVTSTVSVWTAACWSVTVSTNVRVAGADNCGAAKLVLAVLVLARATVGVPVCVHAYVSVA